MIQSTYKPQRVSNFEASKLNFVGTGVLGSVPAGSITNIDYTVSDDYLLTGVMLNCQNQTFGDQVTFQVLDLSGNAKLYNDASQTWFSVPAGTLLNTFVSNWRLTADWQRQVDENLPYPAKIYGGLTLRLIYTSTAAAQTVANPSVTVSINYDLHKVLF